MALYVLVLCWIVTHASAIPQAQHKVQCPKHCLCNPMTRVANCTQDGAPISEVVTSLSPSTVHLVLRGSHLVEDNRTQNVSKHTQTLQLTGATADEHLLSVLFDMLGYDMRSISVQRSPVEYLDTAHFEVQRHLQMLDLSHNNLRWLAPGALGGADSLPKLHVLDLSYNKLEFLDATLLQGLTSLHMLNLQHNLIKMFAPSTFSGLASLRHLNIEANRLDSLTKQSMDPLNLDRLQLSRNPWDCHCGLLWLHSQVTVKDSNVSEVICSSPSELSGMSLASIGSQQLTCVPHSAELSSNVSVVLHMHSAIIDCQVAGYPHPSVVWLTPRGPLVNPDNMRWVPSDVAKSVPVSRSFIGRPTYYESRIEILANGSLNISMLRNYFCGRYTCLAYGPSSTEVANATFVLMVDSAVTVYLTMASMIGAVSAGCLLVFAVFICLLNKCVQRMCLEPRSHVKVLSVVIEPRDGGPPSNRTVEGSPKSISSGKPGTPIVGLSSVPEEHEGESPNMHTLEGSPNSPSKFGTPTADGSESTRHTLEDVRCRLRSGVESGVGRLRTGAHSVRVSSSRRLQMMRESTSNYAHSVRESTSHYARKVGESSSHYAHTMLDSSSHYAQAVRNSGSRYMRTIRDSSSGYAQRMRYGVAMGVEQMKCHIHSMKELCGTGEMIQTVSMVSISTDVDSYDRMQVVKNVSFV